MSLAALYSALAYLHASTVSAVRSASWAAAIFCSRASCCDSRSLLGLRPSVARSHLLRQPRLLGLRALARLDVLLAGARPSRSRWSASRPDRRLPPRPWPARRDSVWILRLQLILLVSAIAVFSLMFAMIASRRDSSRSFDCHSSCGRSRRASRRPPSGRGARLATSGSLAWLVSRRVSSAWSSRGFGGVAHPAATASARARSRRASPLHWAAFSSAFFLSLVSWRVLACARSCL